MANDKHWIVRREFVKTLDFILKVLNDEDITKVFDVYYPMFGDENKAGEGEAQA